MALRRAVIAFVLVQLIAFAVSAQESAELGRASGGELLLTMKRPTALSGSLQASLTSGSDVLGRGNSPAYGATAGGSLVQDRLWFFASASRQASPMRFTNAALPQHAIASAINARVNGDIGSRQDFSAFFQAARRPELSTTGAATFTGSVPSSFLSLHYTGIVSSNMFFNASVTRSSRTALGIGMMPAQ
jgi:hypothetical protein